MITFRRFIILSIFGGFSWGGWQVYTYFLDVSTPILVINGVKEGGYYSGDVQCFVANDKSGELSIWFDEKPLATKFKLNAHQKEHSFVIPTKTLSNGFHHFKAEFSDNTFHRNKAVIEHDLHVDNILLQAVLVKSGTPQKVFQGRTLHIQFQVNKKIKEAKVHALANIFDCFPESKNSSVYECFVPIACEEQPSEYLFSIDLADHVGNTLHLDNKFQVVFYPFKHQTIHVTKEKIEEEKEFGRDNKEFEQEILNIVKNSLGEKLWRGAFCTPIDVERVTCEFGTIRTTQHKGRYAHKALDIINAPKSVVWAPQDGIVVLKDRFASSGNTVVIDHGCGIISMFFHLDDFADIEIGQKLAQGNPIGNIGKTGYVTGYHLHWEMRVNNIPVDPMQWTKTMF